METLKMLKVDELAIPQSIANVMHEGIAFRDADIDLGELIYFGSIFDKIYDKHVAGHYEIPSKDVPLLVELCKLSKEYEYILVAKI